MRTVWQFHTSGQLVFGWGAVRQLPALVLRRKFRRVFLVTDRVLAGNGILEQVRTKRQQRNSRFLPSKS